MRLFMRAMYLALLILLISGCSTQSKITLLNYSHVNKNVLPKLLNKLYAENNIIRSESDLDHVNKGILVSSQEYPDFKTANLFTIVKFKLDKHPPKNKGPRVNRNILTSIYYCSGERVGVYRSFTDGDKKYYLAIFRTINVLPEKIIDLRIQKNLCFKAFLSNYTHSFRSNEVRVN